MTLVRLPPEVAQLQARIQQGMQDPARPDRNRIINDAAKVLAVLLALPDEEPRVASLLEEGNNLTTERDELQIRVHTFTADVVACDEVNRDLRQQITEFRAVNTALARARPQASEGPQHEREKLPDPEKFNGSDKTKLR